MYEIVTEALFHPRDDGNRFYLLHRPKRTHISKGALLHVHSFAEEMNKSRRTVSLTARVLASHGWWVLQHDLLGCGDSSGDFGDATWDAWMKDIASAFQWLADRSGAVPVLWGLRLGCLLAVSAAEHLHGRPSLLFWQPVLSGRVFLHHFLRVKIAGNALTDGLQTISTKDLLQALKDGVPQSIAGYQLASDLAVPMERAEFRVHAGELGKIAICELATTETERTLSPGLARNVSTWQASGYEVHWETVDDLPFWQTQEIADGPGFRGATLRLIERLRA